MNQDYKQLLSQVIKKQIVILGPDITLAKARNVPGLVVADDGTVTDISGDQQQITQKLIDQFVQLSGEIVRKTMEPLLSINQAPNPTPAVTTSPIIPTTAPVPNLTQVQDTQPMPAPIPQPTPTTMTQDTLAQGTKPMQ